MCKKTPNVQWNWQANDGISIPFDGVPFLTAGRKWFQCHQGNDIDAPQKKKRKAQKDAIEVLN